MNKKILTLGIALLVLCATAIARVPSGDEANMTFSTVSSGAKLELYNGGQTKINVPETHGGADVTTIGATAFNDPAIEMIYLPITTTTVEENAFLNCGDDVIVIIELTDPLADVPKDVNNWGMGDYTAEIRHVTDTGRTDLFIVKGEITEMPDVDCSNIKAGSIYELLVEANIHKTNYTSITFVPESDLPKSSISSNAYDISEYKTGCVMMWADGTDIKIWFMNDELIMHEDMSYYFSSTKTGNANTSALKNITEINGIEYLNTERTTDMSRMFSDCAVLLELDLSTFNTENVTDMQWMFYYCYKLKSLDISSFVTDVTTNMRGMFSWCRELLDLDVAHFNTENVTDMSFMFQACYALPEINVSNFDTSNVENMTFMFASTNAIRSLYLLNFDTSNVTNMASMFSMSRAESLDLTSFDTSNVTNMSSMFSSLYIKDKFDITTFDTSNVTNMSGMFYGISGVPTLDLLHFDTSNVTDMSGMFNYSNFTTLYLTSFDTSNVTNMQYMFAHSYIKTLNLSTFDTSLAVVSTHSSQNGMYRMFYECQSSLVVSTRSTSDKSNMITHGVRTSGCVIN